MARPPKVNIDAALQRIVDRVTTRAQAAVLDLGATIDELLSVPGATERSVFEALAKATSPIAQRASSSTLSAMRTTIEASVGREADAVAREVFERAGVSGRWTWVAVLDARTCDKGLGPGGCEQRHARSFTEAELADIGEPRAGGTVCRGNCRCVIVPEEIAVEDATVRADLKDPIRRPRRKRRQT